VPIKSLRGGILQLVIRAVGHTLGLINVVESFEHVLQ
jgi:hypothetical protein